MARCTRRAAVLSGLRRSSRGIFNTVMRASVAACFDRALSLIAGRERMLLEGSLAGCAARDIAQRRWHRA
jgi:hypothetical protein